MDLINFATPKVGAKYDLFVQYTDLRWPLYFCYAESGYAECS